MMWTFILFAGCNTSPQEQTTGTTPQPTDQNIQNNPNNNRHNQQARGPHNNNRPQHNNRKNHNQPRGNMLGSSAAEDLRSSWKSTFAVDVPREKSKQECPDKDKDGFVDATACPWNPVEKLDCDDTDPNVTPKTEIWVPPGPFIMGSNSTHAGADEKPTHVVQLSGYCLDKYEVTTQQWSTWLIDNNRTPQGADIRGIDNQGNALASRKEFPAEGVVWSEANDYCLSLGKSLPTEAQWEKAARGGCELGDDKNKCDKSDLRAYPWGSQQPSCQLANHQLSIQFPPKICVSDTVTNTTTKNGASPYGHMHLAGNVWEFVLDYWHPKVYASSTTRKDPKGPKAGEIHVLKGGSWNTFSTNMRVANRFHDLVMGSAAGFRCARPTVEAVYDQIDPLQLTTISGQIDGSQLGKLTGRAIYVTAFDAADADSTGRLVPGRSPVAEIRLSPNNLTTQDFTLEVPISGKYLVSAAIDNGSGGQKEKYISASGSGGFGNADQNPITVNSAQSGITISIAPAPPAP